MKKEFGGNNRSADASWRRASLKELSESMRRRYWKQHEEPRLWDLAGSANIETSQIQGAIGPLAQMPNKPAGYHGWPLDGDLVNKSDLIVYIVGEAGKGQPWEVRAVKPQSRDDAGFDADFFKFQGTWYKIPGGAKVYITGKNGKYKRYGFHGKAESGDAEACEKLLREYLGGGS